MPGQSEQQVQTTPAGATTTPAVSSGPATSGGRGNAARLEDLGLARLDPAADLLARLRAAPALLESFLDGLPTEAGVALAEQLPDLPEAVAWLQQSARGRGPAVDARGSVGSWMVDQAIGLLGFETGDTEDRAALVQQTSVNFLAATDSLKILSRSARAAGEDSAGADTIDRVVGSLEGAESLAGGLKTLVDTRDKFVLLQELYRTSKAVAAVDVRGPEAAAAFDAWFAASGEVGMELCAYAGPWGPILAPFASLWKEIGGAGMFSAVQANMQPQGGKDMWAPIAELTREGF